jgi:hypothetical protein
VRRLRNGGAQRFSDGSDTEDEDDDFSGMDDLIGKLGGKSEN